MEVYNINELINWLKEMQSYGLEYVCAGEIEMKMKELSKLPLGRGNELHEGIKKISKLNPKILNQNLSTINLLSLGMGVSRSTVYRWRKKGIIAGIDRNTLLLHLRDVDQHQRFYNELLVAFNHMMELREKEDCEYKTINNNTCEYLMGISPDIYKRLRRKKYISGEMFYTVMEYIECKLDEIEKQQTS